jgi:Reverse transcriptase (RNA-dependent DNA polymerase)
MYFRYHDLRVLFRDADDNFKIHSKAGVVQGCPLSPALFQMVMSEVLTQVRTIKDSLILAYLDDVSMIFDNLKDAWKALLQVQKKALKAGLKLNLNKCSLLYLASENSAEDEKFLGRFENAGVVVSREGAEVLGSFIGTKEYITRNTQIRFEQMTAKLQFFISAVELESTGSNGEKGFMRQKFFSYVQFALNHLPTYILRVVSPQVTKDFTTTYDHQLIKCFFSLVHNHRLHPHPLLTDLKRRIEENDHTPRSRSSANRIFCGTGGASFRSAEKTRIPAFLGSIALTAKSIQQALTFLFPEETLDPTDLTLSAPCELLMRYDLLQNIKSSLPAGSPTPTIFDVGDEIFPIFNPLKVRQGVQRLLYSITEEKARRQIVGETRTYAIQDKVFGELYRCKFERQTLQGKPAWMHLPLREDLKHTLLEDDIIQAELIKSIGEHPYVPDKCAMCEEQLITETKPSEGHGVSCHPTCCGVRSLAGSTVENAVRGAIRMFDESAEKKPILDNLPVMPRIDPTKPAKKIGDIFSTKCGRIVVLDVLFSHRKYLSLETLEKIKTAEYKHNRFYDERHFVPCVITAEGTWGPRMKWYFEELRETVRRTRLSPSHDQRLAVRRARETISHAVCKANMIYLRSSREGYVYTGSPTTMGDDGDLEFEDLGTYD